jgi:hypothetical protein
VLDPFCGRGTTLFAARALGLPSIGIDSSPVAAAVAQAKLAHASPDEVVAAARFILAEPGDPSPPPRGEFWNWAFHAGTLAQMCRLRQALLDRCDSAARVLLRAIVLGAIHGPLTKGAPSHFSNQCPRTYAPKPRYAAQFWKERRLQPPRVDVLDVIAARAARFLDRAPPAGRGAVIQADSRDVRWEGERRRVAWIVTSPPYYGMRTYIPDQWLRYWFLGGPAEVAYHFDGQLQHQSPDGFIAQLASVWRNAASICRRGARLAVRFGGINDRKQDPLAILKRSLAAAGWRTLTARPAGHSGHGRRQADQFARARRVPVPEYDFYAVWDG